MNTSRVQKTKVLQCAAAGPSRYQHGLAERTGCVRYGNVMKNYEAVPKFFFLALQPPLGVVFYSPLAGFSLLAYEVSWSHTTTRHSR